MVKGPIGRIGKPINNRKYIFFKSKGIELFIEKKIIDDLAKEDGNIKVLMGDYGYSLICLK